MCYLCEKYWQPITVQYHIVKRKLKRGRQRWGAFWEKLQGEMIFEMGSGRVGKVLTGRYRGSKVGGNVSAIRSAWAKAWEKIAGEWEMVSSLLWLQKGR